MLQRERRPGTSCQSCSSVQFGALRARPDLPTVRPSLAKTRTVCASLHRGQRCVLVSFIWYSSVYLNGKKTLPVSPAADTTEGFWLVDEIQRDCKQLVLLCNANVSPVNSRRHRWLASGSIYSPDLQTPLPSLQCCFY